MTNQPRRLPPSPGVDALAAMAPAVARRDAIAAISRRAIHRGAAAFLRETHGLPPHPADTRPAEAPE